MLCKIAADSTAVEPVRWPAVAPRRREQPSTPPSSHAAARSREEVNSELAQLAQLQQAHQNDLAQCRQAALEEGFRKGREAASAEIKNTSDRLAQLVADLAGLKRRIRNEAEADVVKLSLAIARRILHRELSADPESIQGIVYAGLQKLHNREVSRVRVAPSAIDAVRPALDRAGVTSSITLTADPKMKNGEIVFETALGDLDASIETQLHEIERGFADRLGHTC